jgi:hypothetical protein
VDKIQALISRYSFDPFEIAVTFPVFDGQTYPVVVVPDGVRTPVAAKADLIENDKHLIRHGDVYFRTLAANGAVSTAAAKPSDWADIAEICLDNREADLGRFLRRQLGASGTGALRAAPVSMDSEAAYPSLSTQREPLPHLSTDIHFDSGAAVAAHLLKDGEKRFQEALALRNLSEEERAIVEMGSWQVAVVIIPLAHGELPNQEFISKIGSSNPQYTGWPVWIDSRGFTDQSSAPVVKGGAWEALIIALKGWSRHVDFWPLDPAGKFYLWRNLPDDVSDRVTPRVVLDPLIVISRVAEAILVGLAFGKNLGWNVEASTLVFTFKWTRLSGRRLESWADPMALIDSYGAAHDNEVISSVELPLDTPASAIAPFVEQAVRPLFVVSMGMKYRAEWWKHRF